MGKAGRWLKSLLQAGKKGRPPPPPPLPEAMPVTAVQVGAIPKEKRWSFRRPVPAEKAAEAEAEPVLGLQTAESGFDQKKHAVAVAVATAAAADAAVAAAQAAAAAAAIRLSTSRKPHLPASVVEEAAAVRIQATFRGYLARTALCALRGIVRLQALVRGQLVRKQATATLRCMQALLMAQSQLRAQRIRLLQEQEQEHPHHHQPPPRPRQSPHHLRHRRSYEMDRSCEENAKIVEVDSSEPAWRGAAKGDHGRCSPAPSAMTEMMSPRTYSGHFEDQPFATAHSSPQHASEPFPSYMANTESSRAKARSQSAPRQRTDVLERQPSRRKGAAVSAAAAAVPRSARMQRSSSSSAQTGAAPRWSAAKLDASVDDSECGSTSSVLTAATVYSRTRSLVGFEVRRGVY